MVVLVALLAVVLLLDRQTFDSRQVTGTIVGYETNAGRRVVVVQVKNNTSRTLRHRHFESWGDAIVMDEAFQIKTLNGGLMDIPRATNILTGKDATLRWQVGLQGRVKEVQMKFETLPLAEKAPVWVKKYLPDRLIKPRAVQVSAKPGEVLEQ